MKLPLNFILMILTAMTLTACVAGQPPPAQDNDPDIPPLLLLTDEQQAYQLGPHVAMLEDAEKRWSIEDVASPEFAQHFVPSEVDELNIGAVDSAYWVRIQLHNNSQRSEWWLEHTDPGISYLDFYTPRPDGPGFKHTQTGLLRPYTPQDISTLSYVLSLSIPPQSTQTLFVRYEHTRARGLPLHLWSPAAYVNHNQLVIWRMVSLVTINLLIFIGLVLLWSWFRLKILLYLLLTMFAILVNITIEQGIGRQYLWPNLNLGVWNLYLINVGGALIILFGVKFTMQFLDTKQKFPKWHKILQALIILSLLVLVQIPFVADHIVNPQLTALYLLTLPLIFVFGFWAWNQNFQRNLNSIFTSLLLVIFLIAAITGVIGSNGVFPFLQTEQLRFLSNLLFISLLVIFISYNIYNAFKKREEAQHQQKESALALQKANEELEQRVLDRTQKLSILYDVTSIASKGLNSRTTIDQCLDRVVTDMNSNFGVIHMVDDTGQILRLASSLGISSETLTKIGEIPVGKGLTGQVLQQGEVLIVSNAAKDPRKLPVAGLDDLQSYVGVPIRASGAILGVLGVARLRGQPMFDAREIDLLESVANQVGVVVESAILRENTERAVVLEERQRLARELHDSVTQSLHSANLIAGALPLKWAKDPEEGKLGLEHIQRFAKGALAEMRMLLLELYPKALEEQDLHFLLRELADAMMAQTRVIITVSVSREWELPHDVKIAFYRIAQEALNNAVKHADARKIRIDLRYPNALPKPSDRLQTVLGIMDDGHGFDNEDIQLTGLGISIMHERAREINAALSITSQPDLGTEVLVVWPDAGKHKLNSSDHKPGGHQRELVDGDEP